MRKSLMSGAIGLCIVVLLWLYFSREPERRVQATNGLGLRVLTYNVLGEPGRKDVWLAVFEILRESRADILCLQEVDSSLLHALHQEPWFKGTYELPQWNDFHAFPNGNYICARFPVERVEIVRHLGSKQRRRSLVVHFRVHGELIAVATCHLESPLESGGIREQQIREIFARLGKDQDAIFAGDFNFGDGEEPETAALDPRFSDLWTELHPGDPGYTWDMEKSEMAKKDAFPGERSRRIDRILWRSDRWRAESVRIIGSQALDADGERFPSDHFGLLGVLRMSRR